MDTLASLMEVKLDIREKRTEIPLRSWTRCYIKIEAIKCFPCYLKITFHKNVTEKNPSLVLRINIPGLEIYPVKSRTKQFAYGLYWKHNRKQCIAFLSLDSQLSMEAHMKWVECQIQNLEQYRKEVLQSSRCSRMEKSFTADSEMYQNMNETSRMRPLPQIPIDSDKSMQRMSGMSGIYEEIPDFSRHSKYDRESVIYEEMKLNHQPVESPPPLPPRKRLDTDCSNLHRSYTSPESDYYLVKKKWNIFDNVFGKGKKIEPKRREKTDKPVSPREIQLLKTKRNSFSSPDLSHLYCPMDANLNTSGCSNCSFDQSNISSSNSYELENVCEEEDEIVLENVQMSGKNISQQIKDNFEPHLNNDMSRVNLVGSNFNLNESVPPKSSPLTPPGYLEMRPGKGFDMRKVEEMDKHLLQNDVLYRLKYSFDSPITYKREYEMYDSPPARPLKNSIEKEPLYLPMNVGTKYSPNVSPKNQQAEENVYVPMNRKPATTILVSPPPTTDETSSVQTRHANNNVCSVAPLSNENNENNRNKRNSVDDKIASYYPNYDVPARIKQHTHVRSFTAESVICSKTPDIERKVHTLERAVSAAVPIPSRKVRRLRSFTTKGASNSLNDGNNNTNADSPQIDATSRKYATIARITSPPKHKSSNEDLLKDSNHGTSEFTKKSGSVSPTSIKRFSSLTKFKKIDFSPLRLKISSVLQRHNSGSC